MRAIVAARLLMAAATTIAIACGSDAATGPDDDVPVGLEVHLNGALVVRIDGSEVDGHLHTHVGLYSGQFIVTAINGAGNVIDTPGLFSLEATTGAPEIASFVQVAEGALEGEIVSSAPGSTQLTLRLLWSSAPNTGAPALDAPPIEVIAVLCPSPPLQPASLRASSSRASTTSSPSTACAARTRP